MLLSSSIIGFLTDATLFFHKRKARRLLSIFSGPLESKFRDALERIGRLSDWVEADVRAAAIASQHSTNAALSLQLQEISLFTRHAMQGVLEIKQLQAAALLRQIRCELFHGLDHDLKFQEEVTQEFASLVGGEWDLWVSQEMRHAPSYYHHGSRFCYIQTETIQYLMEVLIAQQSLRSSHTARYTTFYWSSRMTLKTAMASLIYRYLAQHTAELLLRHETDYYMAKFKESARCVNTLRDLYIQVTAALPGCRTMVCVPNDGEEAAAFVKMMIEIAELQSNKSRSMLIYHPMEPELSDASNLVQMDTMYDIDPRMDTSDSLFRIAVTALRGSEEKSEDFRSCLWSGLWRTLRYNLIVLTYETMLNEVNNSFINPLERTSFSPQQRQSSGASLKRTLISFFQCIERDITESCRQFLSTLLSGMMSLETYYSTQYREPEPLQSHQRGALWDTVEAIFQKTVQDLFLNLARDRLSFFKATMDFLDVEAISSDATILEALEALEDCFMLSEWDLDCLQTVQQAIRDTIQEAAAAGLKQIMEMYMVSTTEVIEDTGA